MLMLEKCDSSNTVKMNELLSASFIGKSWLGFCFNTGKLL